MRHILNIVLRGERLLLHRVQTFTNIGVKSLFSWERIMSSNQNRGTHARHAHVNADNAGGGSKRTMNKPPTPLGSEGVMRLLRKELSISEAEIPQEIGALPIPRLPVVLASQLAGWKTSSHGIPRAASRALNSSVYTVFHAEFECGLRFGFKGLQERFISKN